MFVQFVAPKRDEQVITVGGPGSDVNGFSSIAIQRAVDMIKSRGGGTVKLGQGDYEIIGPIRLYDDITLTGAGESTILRKADGFKTSFIVDADYGELKATVEDAGGFKVGMGIQLYDSENANGWDVSTAVITAIEGNTIHFDEYLVKDYLSERNGVISNACSIIGGVAVKRVRISHVTIEGNKDCNEPINGCRGGGIYLHKAQDCVIEHVQVRNFSGDGISWQITNGITVRNCEVSGSSGLGLHPGTGSHGSVVEGCHSHDNGSDGLFVCWRVQHGVFSNNKLSHNGRSGINIGHKDTDNLFEGNHIHDNEVCGVYVRAESKHNGANRNRYVNNLIENNGGTEQGCGFLINGSTDDVAIEGNTIRDTGAGRQKIGIRIMRNTTNVSLHNNTMSGHQEADVSEA